MNAAVNAGRGADALLIRQGPHRETNTGVIRKALVVLLLSFGVIGSSVPRADALPSVSDVVETAQNVVGDAGSAGVGIVVAAKGGLGVAVDAGRTGVGVVVDAGGAVLHGVVEGAKVVGDLVVDAVGDVIGFVRWTIDRAFYFCDHLRPCGWIHHLTADELNTFVGWMNAHPTETMWMATGVMLLVPAGLEIYAVRVAALGIGEVIGIGGIPLILDDAAVVLGGVAPAEAAELSTEALETMVTPGLRQTVTRNAEAAIVNGDETFSLCGTTMPTCVIDKEGLDPRINLRGTPVETEVLERQSGLYPDGTPIDIADRASWHIDHRMPLSCGGTNHLNNLMVITMVENLAKGNYDSCTRIPIDILMSVLGGAA